MKRLAFLLVAVFPLGLAMAAPAPDNQDLHGSVLYDADKETAPETMTRQSARDPATIRDRQAAEATTARPMPFGDAYGSILHDTDSDPWGELRE